MVAVPQATAGAFRAPIAAGIEGASRRLHPIWLALAVLVSSSLLPFVARAQSEETGSVAAHVARGEKLYREARFTPALDAFSAAYRAKPAPPLLIWMGRCHRGLGAWEAATFFFRGYLAYAPDAPDRAEVERLITETNAARAGEELRARTSPAPSTPPSTSIVPVAAMPVAVAPPTPLYRRWWLWTLVAGAIVAGGVAATLGVVLESHPVPFDQLGTIDGRR